MGLSEDIEKLLNLGADQETIAIYRGIYTGILSDIPEWWFERQFEEMINLKYDNFLDKMNDPINVRDRELRVVEIMKATK